MRDSQTKRVHRDLAPAELFEIRTPAGPVTITAPLDWTIHDTAVVHQIMRAFGYKAVASDAESGGPLFAYAPDVPKPVSAELARQQVEFQRGE